jgi:hypothetical protein
LLWKLKYLSSDSSVSQCSKTCGKGERHRQVVCVEVPANTYPYQQSVNQHWPASSLLDAKYYYEHWRLVDNQRRLKPKLLSDADIVVSSAKCDHTQIPKTVRGCLKHCPFSWVEGEWSEVYYETL